MKKVMMMGALFLAVASFSAQAQTTSGSGTGNGTNGSAAQNGKTYPSGTKRSGTMDNRSENGTRMSRRDRKTGSNADMNETSGRRNGEMTTHSGSMSNQSGSTMSKGRKGRRMNGNGMGTGSSSTNGSSSSSTGTNPPR